LGGEENGERPEAARFRGTEEAVEAKERLNRLTADREKAERWRVARPPIGGC
jgi:hypothetical protein